MKARIAADPAVPASSSSRGIAPGATGLATTYQDDPRSEDESQEDETSVYQSGVTVCTSKSTPPECAGMDPHDDGSIDMHDADQGYTADSAEDFEATPRPLEPSAALVIAGPAAVGGSSPPASLQTRSVELVGVESEQVDAQHGTSFLSGGNSQSWHSHESQDDDYARARLEGERARLEGEQKELERLTQERARLEQEREQEREQKRELEMERDRIAKELELERDRSERERAERERAEMERERLAKELRELDRRAHERRPEDHIPQPADVEHKSDREHKHEQSADLDRVQLKASESGASGSDTKVVEDTRAKTPPLTTSPVDIKAPSSTAEVVPASAGAVRHSNIEVECNPDEAEPPSGQDAVGCRHIQQHQPRGFCWCSQRSRSARSGAAGFGGCGFLSY